MSLPSYTNNTLPHAPAILFNYIKKKKKNGVKNSLSHW